MFVLRCGKRIAELPHLEEYEDLLLDDEYIYYDEKTGESFVKDYRKFNNLIKINALMEQLECLWYDYDLIVFTDEELCEFADSVNCSRYYVSEKVCRKLMNIITSDMLFMEYDISQGTIIGIMNQGHPHDDDYIRCQVVQGERHKYIVGKGGSRSLFADLNKGVGGKGYRVLETRENLSYLMDFNCNLGNLLSWGRTFLDMSASNQCLEEYLTSVGFDFEKCLWNETVCKMAYGFIESEIGKLQDNAACGKVIGHIE